MILLPKAIAAPLGLFMGVSATAVIAATATASAATSQPWTTAPAYWGEILHDSLFHPVMGVTFEGFSEGKPVQSGEFAICIANHPSTLGISEFGLSLTRHVSRRPVVVAKHDLEWILRIPCNALGLTIPIDRNDRVAAQETVRQRIPELVRSSATLVVLPDTTRPTQEKRDKARTKWIARIPEFDTWSTLPPRSGVLLAILQALPHPVRIFNMTHGFSRFDETWRSIYDLYGATYHAHTEVLRSDELPLNEPGLQAWLNREWGRKNRLIASWRGNRYQ